MNEQRNNLPKEYVEEALKLKEKHKKQMEEHLKNRVNKGRDYNSKEEYRIDNEFYKELADLKIKYGIKF